MKHSTQRFFALLLVLAMCFSLINTGFVLAADYATGDAGAFTGVVVNWGSRGTASTYLSDYAKQFYKTYGTSYDTLSALEGAADVQNVAGSELYSALSSLMSSAHTTITSYNDTRDLYKFTDCQNSDPSSISSFYSGKAIGPDWDSGATWNREHTWPDSKGMGGDDENDIMMLRPTAGSENSGRSNKAYGESSGFYNPNAISSEKYDLRGDVARIALYVYVRWGNTEKMWGTDGMIESMDVLLSWMEQDPVDTWEMGRNDSVQSITGTRNVFVDYPELAFLLFAQEIPSGMTTPSGEASSSDLYTITASSSNDEHGTVSVSGNTVNAFPAEGYTAAGYTLISGSAEVVRNGNTFTVNTAADCEIRIDFEARQTAEVSFTENGAAADSQTVYLGDAITLPDHSTAVVTGYTFLGWVTDSLAETTEAPAAVYVSGSNYTVEDAISFYALYSRVDENGTGTSSVYNLYSGVIAEGDYLIVYDGGALQAANGSGGRLAYADVTVNKDSIENPSMDLVWHISATEDGYYTLFNEENSVYAGGTGAKNKAGLLTEVTDYAKWSVSGETAFEFVNLGNFNKGVNYTLRKNSTYGYACYGATTGGALSLYKSVSGTVYYSTETKACEHANAEEVPGQEPDCTQDGYTAGVYCKDCASYISGHEILKAKGHSYDAVITGPTATEGGYTTYTCTVCQDTYVSDYTDPTGEEYTVSFSVPDGVQAVEEMLCNNRGIILPEADIPEGEYAYTFVGWAEQPVDNVQDAPVFYGAGSTYYAQDNVTLYAVYTYLVGEAGTGAWNLVTDAATLQPGAQLVLASSAKGYVAGKISSQYMTSIAAVFSEDGTVLTELPADAVVLTLGGSAENWTFANEDGQLLGATAVKKLAWDKGETTWTVSVDEGLATVSSANSKYGRFLYNVNSPRFTTYTSNTSVSMLLPQLFSKDMGSGTVYYTTVITAPCAHNGDTELRGQVDPDYLNDGYTGDLHCADCGELLEQGSTVSRNPFEDVPEDNFTDAILWAYYSGITMGTTQTTFSPDQACTREQFVTFLWRAAGSPEPDSLENPFTDVPHDRFEKAILWAYHSGITYGKTETTFCPDDPCTREQVVTMLWRATGSQEPVSMENPFADVPHDRFEKAILWAYYNQITFGTRVNTFDPDEPCTREQVVAFFYRYMQSNKPVL